MNNLSQNLLCRPFSFNESSRNGVLLIHGFTATPGTLLPLGAYLARYDCRVEGILLPGHGTNAADMERCSWRDWLSAAQKGYDRLAQTCDSVSVVGLSMGGALALLVAASRPAARTVPVCAALKVQNHASRFARYVRPIMRYYTERARESDPGFLQEYNACYDCTPLRSIEQLNILMKKARQQLKNIHCPLLIVRAGKDATVCPESAEMILRQTASANKRLYTLPNSPHVCTLGPERDRLFQEVAAFLQLERNADL